jgi:hypothetical protein
VLDSSPVGSLYDTQDLSRGVLFDGAREATGADSQGLLQLDYDEAPPLYIIRAAAERSPVVPVGYEQADGAPRMYGQGMITLNGMFDIVTRARCNDIPCDLGLRA